MNSKNGLGEFKFEVKHPKIGMFHLVLTQDVLDKLHKYSQFLWPWILSALLSGLGFFGISHTTDFGPQQNQSNLPAKNK